MLLVALLLMVLLLDDNNLWLLFDDNCLRMRMVWMRSYVHAVGCKKWICNLHVPVTPRKEKGEKDKKYHFLHILLLGSFIEGRGVSFAVCELHDDFFFHDAVYTIAESLILHSFNPLFLLEFIAEYLAVFS